ncbi:MAG: hypothetical protein MUF18_04495 [Fimbriiglobus sp.]|nr:hypothetical protein [Fimbriiglobus sp.]
MKRFVAAVVMLVGFVATVVAAPPKPALEVRLLAATDLVPVAEYAGGLFGQGEQVKQFGEIVKALAENEKGLEGIDLKRPLGAYAVVADKIEDSTVVIMIPVADEDSVVALFSGKLNLDPKKDEKTGTYSMDVPNFPSTVYFRFADKYLYATLRSADGVGKDKLIAPKAFFTDKTTSVVSATIHFDRIPTDLRTAVYGQLELQLKEQAQGTTDPAQKRIQGFIIDAGVGAIKTLLTDGDTLSLAVDVEPKTDDIKLGVTVTPKAGSTLAKTFTSFADRECLAAAVAAAKNPVLALGLNFALPPETKKQFASLAEGLAKDAVEAAKNDDKVTTKMLTDALLPTLTAGDAQLGVVLSDAGKGKIGLTAALKTVEGKEIERTAKLFGQFLPKEAAEFTPDVEKAGGRNVHKLTVTESPFASDTLWLLTGDDLLAVHSGAKADGVKGIGAAKPVKAPMLHFEMSWVRFVRLVNSADAETVKNAITSVFETNKTDGLDTMTVTGTGGKQLTLNVTLKGKAFAFLATVNQN